MIVDISWVRNNFRRFNAEYFDNQLPEPHFRVGKARTQLGSCSWKSRSRMGRTSFYDFTITLSNYYDKSEHMFQSVLLHEMIHLSIAHSGVKDTSAHGVVFRGMMERLNRYGWDIRVSHTTAGMEKAYTGSSRVIRTYLVAAIETSKGEYFLSRVNPRYAYQLDDKLRDSKDIRHHAWYTTDDRWFENKPEVRSLRGFRLSEEEYRQKTAAMQPFPLRTR